MAQQPQSGQSERVTVRTAKGDVDIMVPVGMSDQAIQAKLQAKHPELFQKGEPTPKPGVLGRPAMPGTASRYAGPQSKALSAKMRESRDMPMEVAKVAAPTIVGSVAPEAMLPGAIASIAGRGAAALGGASYGGRMAKDVGLPKWTGQAVGGAAGALLPEFTDKMGGPLISKVLRAMGRGGTEAAEGAAAGGAAGAETTGLMGEDALRARTLAEKVARGVELSPEDEAAFNAHVQKNYTPRAGIGTAEKEAGRMYAGRGSAYRPTDAQLAQGQEMSSDILLKDAIARFKNTKPWSGSDTPLPPIRNPNP